MKYGININQFAIIRGGFDFDLTDAAVFDVLKGYCNSPACKKMSHEGKLFFNVPYAVVIDQLPIARLNKPDSVYRRYQKLEQYGVLEMHPDNKRVKQVWFAWGRNYDKMIFANQTGSKSEQPVFDPVKEDENDNQTGSKSVLRPDQNPAHNTITVSNSYYSVSADAPNERSPLEANPFEMEILAPPAAPPAPLPAATARAKDADEAEAIIRAWANGDGLETVKNWINQATYSEKTHGPVRDEIAKFVGHYATTDEYKIFNDPVKFFRNRFKAWLIQAKTYNKPAASNPAPATTYAKPRYLEL